MNEPTGRNSPVALWWILWVATLAGLIAFYTLLKPSGISEPSASFRFIPFFPFVAAVVVRWLLLPRFHERTRAFPIFVLGIAFSEACALMGIFLAPDLRTLYFVLAIVGLLQYLPFFLLSIED
jgi:hypothetical protein